MGMGSLALIPCTSLMGFPLPAQTAPGQHPACSLLSAQRAVAFPTLLGGDARQCLSARAGAVTKEHLPDGLRQPWHVLHLAQGSETSMFLGPHYLLQGTRKVPEQTCSTSHCCNAQERKPRMGPKAVNTVGTASCHAMNSMEAALLSSNPRPGDQQHLPAVWTTLQRPARSYAPFPCSTAQTHAPQQAGQGLSLGPGNARGGYLSHHCSWLTAGFNTFMSLPDVACANAMSPLHVSHSRLCVSVGSERVGVLMNVQFSLVLQHFARDRAISCI